MKVDFAVVPPGGGEAEYTFQFEMISPPNVGDYVFKRDYKEGEQPAWAAFVVRQRWFWLQDRDYSVLIEVEPARYYYESQSHKAICDSYVARGKTVQKI
jgi:hypothetical protein